MAKNNTDFEAQPVREPQQQNPYAGMVPLSYKMVTRGITPAPRPSGMIQLAPVVMPLSVVPYASDDQAYYGDNMQQQY